MSKHVKRRRMSQSPPRMVLRLMWATARYTALNSQDCTKQLKRMPFPRGSRCSRHSRDLVPSTTSNQLLPKKCDAPKVSVVRSPHLPLYGLQICLGFIRWQPYFTFVKHNKLYVFFVVCYAQDKGHLVYTLIELIVYDSKCLTVKPNVWRFSLRILVETKFAMIADTDK
jgi:hypothetical protein